MKKRGRPAKKKPVESFVREPKAAILEEEVEFAEVVPSVPDVVPADNASLSRCDCGREIPEGAGQCIACIRRA